MNQKQEKSKRRIQGAYSISVVSITMVLLFFGLTVLLVVNGKRLTDYIKQNIGFTVYLAENSNDAEVKRLEKYLNTEVYSQSVKYISKDEASEIMKDELGEDFEELLGENVFPASIEVQLEPQYAHPDSISDIRLSLVKYTFVSEIFYQESLAEMITQNVRKMSTAGFIFTAVFLIISYALISNTIRMSVYSKRLLIHTAKLLGAEDAFVIRPFVVNSLSIGLLGGALASLVTYLVVMYLRSNFAEVMVLEGEFISIAAIMVFGVLISVVSAYISAKKFVKLSSSDIYFEN
ncbi:MAG: permease-like cell division protein FtsX [Bacteroidota bacterium]|nr:permease-like cell division protein FtsX [Bacteroidota bacterium]